MAAAQAIAAMDGALGSSPGDLEVLLSLGVSHTNELEAAEATGYIARWLQQHPAHGPAARASGSAPDSSQRHSHLARAPAPLPRRILHTFARTVLSRLGARLHWAAWHQPASSVGIQYPCVTCSQGSGDVLCR